MLQHFKGSPVDSVHLVLREDVETHPAGGEATCFFPTLCHMTSLLDCEAFRKQWYAGTAKTKKVLFYNMLKDIFKI